MDTHSFVLQCNLATEAAATVARHQTQGYYSVNASVLSAFLDIIVDLESSDMRCSVT